MKNRSVGKPVGVQKRVSEWAERKVRVWVVCGLSTWRARRARDALEQCPQEELSVCL